MKVVSVGLHEVECNRGEVTYRGDDATLVLQKGEIWNLRASIPPYIFDEKLMAFAIESDSSGEYGHLHHLDIPSGIRGQQWGKLCSALFYTILEDQRVDQFSIKFGGGKDSRQFLESLGFTSDILHTEDDADFTGDSVMVGDFVSTGDRPREWVLYPEDISEFPTGFFSFK